AAFAGACRLAARWGCPTALQAVAGAVFALSPFLLTRVGAGHWGLVAAVGILPWAIPELLEPRDWRMIVIWSSALGFTGFVGGVFAVLIVAVGLIADRRRGATRAALATLLGQLPWLVPGLILSISAGRVAPSVRFRTDLRGPQGVPALLAGRGFWRATSQLGLAGGWAIGIGLVFLVLAVVGAGQLRVGVRGRVLGLGLVGLALTMASGIPGIQGVYERLAETAVGAPLREGQRTLALALVVLAPLGVLGAVALGRRLPRAARMLPAAGVAALAVGLALPGFWGLGGRLQPRSFPRAYVEARRHISVAPGPVLGLPWHEYLDLGYAGGRRVLNPLPDYLGGDVVVSSDPEVPGSAQESADRRAVIFDRSDRRLRSGQPVGALVHDLGIRWVVLLEEVDWHAYTALDSDPSLARVEVGPRLRLYRVKGWRGPVVTESGGSLAITATVQPLEHMVASGRATWFRSGQPGWLRGRKAAKVSRAGTLALPAGSGPIWYWPALVVLLGDLVTIFGVVVACRSLFSHQRSVTVS
ncbi:MAG: hypothetical protein QOG03_1743, partial [Actinomycetota bacterium]|nr:hypothetical protein [Actinomycetota bacterium]